MQHDDPDTLRARIAERLSRFPRLALDGAGMRHAAVAIVVARARAGDEACVLLTLRPATMRRHSSQYALPGGRMDAGETVIETALRELHEELRLELGPDAVLGLLDDYPTRSGFRITPVVLWGGVVSRIDPDPVEVAEVFRIPFRELDSDAMPLFRDTAHFDHPMLYSRLPTLGEPMYAPTAAMLYQFREAAIRGLATRVAHYGQPEFAWK